MADHAAVHADREETRELAETIARNQRAEIVELRARMTGA